MAPRLQYRHLRSLSHEEDTMDTKEAQILAVADVFESMISHRPYRPALGIDAAIGELVTNKGSLYKPEIVDAIVHLVRDKGYRVPK